MMKNTKPKSKLALNKGSLRDISAGWYTHPSTQPPDDTYTCGGGGGGGGMMSLGGPSGCWECLSK
jgi:hypothetical protein